MSRYITELSIPNDMDFHCQVEDLIKQVHKEYSFTRFTFYDDSEKYPLGLFPNGLHLVFAPVTILYGNNGSGKSTILNILAEKLEIGRRSPINNSQFFSLFAKTCEVSTHSDFDEIDRRRDIITSMGRKSSIWMRRAPQNASGRNWRTFGFCMTSSHGRRMSLNRIRNQMVHSGNVLC